MLYEKYIYILALEMASPGNQHCANCVCKLSLHIGLTRFLQLEVCALLAFKTTAVSVDNVDNDNRGPIRLKFRLSSENAF